MMMMMMMIIAVGGMNEWQGNPKYVEICPIAFLSTTDPT
jgi:hypothetical protein